MEGGIEKRSERASMADLVAFAERQEARFKVLDAGKSTELERTYAQTVKLGEEMGELCEGILARAGDQRKEKLEAYSDDELAKEFADVVMVVFILAEKLGVDMPKALAKKIAKVDERFKDVRVD